MGSTRINTIASIHLQLINIGGVPCSLHMLPPSRKQLALESVLASYTVVGKLMTGSYVRKPATTSNYEQTPALQTSSYLFSSSTTTWLLLVDCFTTGEFGMHDYSDRMYVCYSTGIRAIIRTSSQYIVDSSLASSTEQLLASSSYYCSQLATSYWCLGKLYQEV